VKDIDKAAQILERYGMKYRFTNEHYGNTHDKELKKVYLEWIPLSIVKTIEQLGYGIVPMKKEMR
jgi:hypothetical protein